jgi:type IV secretion system protein VirB5
MSLKKKIKRISIISTLCLGSICFQSSFATGWPVVDIAAITQRIKSLVVLGQELDSVKQGVEQAKKEVSDAEGNYGFGNIMGGSSDLKNREWSPTDWKSALKGEAGGNPGRYQQLLSLYKANHPSMDQADIQKIVGEKKAASYQQQVETGQAASINATYSFNNIKKHLDDINQLQKQIEKTKNTKAAIDLNSRISAEQAYLATQQLKMQSLLNQQMAEQSSSDIASETQAAEFNTLPKSQ